MSTQKQLQRMPRERETQSQTAIQTSLADSISSAPSGQPLQQNARDFLEPRMGHSFENVRIHSDSHADTLAQQVNATAFTTGNDIFFSKGAYQPDSSEGKQLLAHELTHTVQQAQGPVSGTPSAGGVSISDPNDSFEQAAVANAAAVIQSPASVSSEPTGQAVQRQATSGVTVQREPEEEELLADGSSMMDLKEEEKTA
jgi:Domain of unknown function (DUF4157)